MQEYKPIWIKEPSEEQIRNRLTISKKSICQKLRMAAIHGSVWLIKNCLEETNVIIDLNDALELASFYNNVEIVKLILSDKRCNPSSEHNYAIRWAAENGHLNIIKLLIKDKRINPAAGNNHAIRWALENGHFDIVEELSRDYRVKKSGYLI